MANQVRPGRKCHHAYPLATHTDCGRSFIGRLERGDTITATNGRQTVHVTNAARNVTCQRCIEAQP